MRDGEQGGKKGEKESMTGVRMRDGSAARKVSAHFSPPRCMGAMCVCVHVRMHACLHSRTHVFVWKETILLLLLLLLLVSLRVGSMSVPNLQAHTLRNFPHALLPETAQRSDRM